MRNTMRMTAVAALVAGVLGLVQAPEAQAARHSRHGSHGSRRRHSGRLGRHSSRRRRYTTIHYRFRPSARVYYSGVPSTSYVYTAPSTVYVAAPPVTYVQPTPTVVYAAPASTAPTAPSTVNPLSDQGIFQAVATMLATDFSGEVSSVRLKVRRGQVEIRGKVADQDLKVQIGLAIADIRGVRNLANKLSVEL